jgi:translation initiation factor IF-1
MDSDGEGSPGRGPSVTGQKERRPGAHEPRARQAERDRAESDVVGAVTEILPSGLYRVRLEQGSVVTAHIADRIDRNFVRILVGDRVRLELSPLDVARGRIVEKM